MDDIPIFIYTITWNTTKVTTHPAKNYFNVLAMFFINLLNYLYPETCLSILPDNTEVA